MFGIKKKNNKKLTDNENNWSENTKKQPNVLGNGRFKEITNRVLRKGENTNWIN